MKIFEPHAHMFSRVTDDYERMAMAGGTLEAGPGRGGGFHLTARIPIEDPEPSATDPP